MKKLMFLILAMFFVFGMSVSLAIAADCYLKWKESGSYKTTVTKNVGETVTVELWVTDILKDPGASSFEVGYTGDTTVGMKYDTNVLQCNSVTVNTDDWPLFTYADWTTTPGRINAGGCAPLGVGHKGDKKLITIEFQCLSEGSEKFDFTEVERFYLGKLGEGSFDVDKGTYALTINCGHPVKKPEVDIKANGQDGPITLNQSDKLTVTISLNNNGITDNADFWLAAVTPFGLYFFTFDGWTDAWVPGYQGPLCYLDSYDVIADMPISGLPAGPYTIYFGVDTVMDGNVTWDKAVYDTVEVNITSE